METPSRALPAPQKRKYTPEEKQQLLANLDLEVAHRTRQFEATLADILENFKNHHEGQVLRVPRLVRGITMAEFGDKWNGDINECLRGLQRERHGGEPAPIDPSIRKRKWQASQEGPGPEEAESSRAVKNARTIPTPKKPETPAALRKQRLNKTPLTSRQLGRPPPTSPSPVKPRTANPLRPQPSSSFVPHSKTFNPTLPKAPAYPRPMRKNESLMSVNGSPLANPYQYGFRFGSPINEEEEGGAAGQSLQEKSIRRSNSSIIVRRDPSFNSTRDHSREPSRDGRTSRNQSSHTVPVPVSPTRTEFSSHRPHSKSSSSSSNTLTEPMPQLSALVRVPMRDGHVLEFDPLSTSPEEIDALQEITGSAKKQAKQDITRMVQAALAKWKL